MLNVVLVHPEIPQNTGNAARLCAAIRATLHIVGPIGFDLSDKYLKRSGMDYWQMLEWRYHESWQAFEALLEGHRKFFIENKTTRLYTDARFDHGDFLIFGRETKGLPESLIERNKDKCLAIPVFHPEARSLNLSNCVAIVCYEAVRQIHLSAGLQQPIFAAT